MDATEQTHVAAASPIHRLRLVLFALLSALFTFGCMTWTTMVEVTRTEEGQHLIGTSIRYEFNKSLWDELKADERQSLSGFGDPLKEQGWNVQTSDGGRIINATRDPAALETLKEQGWTVTEQPLEVGRIITATLPFLGLEGAKSDDPAKEPMQNITIVINESDPAVTRYIYRSTVFIDIDEQAPDSGGDTPPPSSGDDSWGAAIDKAIEENPDVQRLEGALKNAGPPKLVVGAALPGIIEASTINGQPGGVASGGTVQWTIDAQAAGTYNLEATAIGAEMELAITQFDIEGTQEETPDGPAYPVSDTLKVNLRVAGQNKETQKQDFEKYNPIDVKLYYDDKEIDSGQTDSSGNVSFSFSPAEVAPEAAPDGVSSHTVRIVASKKAFKDAEDTKTINIKKGDEKKDGVDLTIDHIEVVQVIQTKDNKIPLVAGKKTVVRVFLKGTGDKTGVISNVRGSIFVWPEGKSEVEISSAANGAISVVNDAEPRRDQTDNSLNFVIPNELTAPGVFSIKAVVNPTRGVKESDYDNNELTEPFEFEQRNSLRIGFVRVGYKPPGASDYQWPTDSISTYTAWLTSVFPVAGIGLQYYELPWRVRVDSQITAGSGSGELLMELREFRDRIDTNRPDIIVGWLPGALSDPGIKGNNLDFGGVAYVGEPSALVRDYKDDPLSGYSAVAMAHELGHSLGLNHTGPTIDPASECSRSEAPSGYWPASYGNSAAIQEVGFDTQQLQVVPGTYYDFMSYCGPRRWISPFHYKKLDDVGLRAPRALIIPNANRLSVRGSISLVGNIAKFRMVELPGGGNGSGRESTAAVPPSSYRYFMSGAANSLLSLGRQSGSSFQLREGTGSHCLRFMDATGALLYERCFDPPTPHPSITGELLEKVDFVLEVPDPGDVASAVLVRNDNGQEQELTDLQVSSNAPTLSITSPKAGDRWEGEHTITWTGSDGDGDEVRYDILYSADGKKSWYPLEVGSLESEYTFSTDEILPGDQTYIRILASDGFNTTSTDVGPIVVPKQPNSPNPPPSPPSEESLYAPAKAATGGLPDWGTMAIIGGVAGAGVLLLLGFVVTRGSRRKARVAPAGVVAAPPTYPQAPPTQPLPANTGQAYYPPAAYTPPAQYNAPPPPVMNPFQRAQMEQVRLRGEVAAGRMAPQQYEAALRAMTVQDGYGRYWMLGALDGLWYVYDGRSWVRANPT